MTAATAFQLTSLTRLLLAAASATVILAGMRAAGGVVGPVVIALLLTIAWSPAADWLRRRGWPSTLAALTGIVLGAVVIALVALLVWSSLNRLQERLPEYQPRVEELRGTSERLLARLPFDATRVLEYPALQPDAIVGHAVTFIRGLTSTAGTLSVLVLIMAFMMIEAVRYPAKLRAAAAPPGVTELLGRFGKSMRDYVVLNTVFGLGAGVLNASFLLVLGVDFAVLWGVVSFAMSYLPNVGFVIALGPPALMALIQFGFGRAAVVIGGLVLINFVVDNVVKPRVVGESFDLSPAIVVVSLIFWGWALGVWGALLAVPLSMAVKFLLEAFDETRWLAKLMSDAGGKRAAPEQA